MRRLVWILALAGCSIGTEQARRMPNGRIVCNSSYVPPIIDTVLGIAGGVASVALMSYRSAEGSTTNDGEQVAHTYGLIIGLVALPLLVAAPLGFERTARCVCAERLQLGP